MNCITCDKPLRCDNSHGYCRSHRQGYLSNYNKEYRKNNRKELIAYSAKYYNDNREQMKAANRISNKIYYENNKEKRRAYEKNRKKLSIQYKLKVNLRSRLYSAIRNEYKAGSAVKDLGCTIPEFKIYLELKFTEGMTWNNYGKWHIDHIIPLANFDLTNREELLKAVHYTNLQPMWAVDNIRKGTKQ